MTPTPLRAARTASSPLERARAALASGLFDQGHYERIAGRAFTTPGAAAADYLQRGWREGLDPSRWFDTRFYLGHSPILARGDLDPLSHYLQIGKGLGLPPRSGRGPVAQDQPPPAPSGFRDRYRRQADRLAGFASSDIVDVVVPVYRGYGETLRCLDSVLGAPGVTPFRLVVIDDAGPLPELSAALDALHAEGIIDVLRNPENLGFVKTANRGFALARDRDVVLLNADAEVHGDWLDRLARHAAHPRVATVTPFSNNATILSYPHTLTANHVALELSASALDALFSETMRGQAVDIPTGVGFCMYVTRAGLDALEGFDTGFGRGYGEENDYCLRAAAAGWRNLAACDTYVGHLGNVSFGQESGEAKRIGLARVLDRHPDYLQRIDRFIADDPLAAVRRSIDIARVRKSLGDTVLHLEHGWGGGLTRHVDELTAHLAEEGINSFRGQSDGRGRLQPTFARRLEFPNLGPIALDSVAALREGLEALGVSHVHVHSLLDWTDTEIGNLLALVADGTLELDFTVHDYACICPRVHMIDWSGVYCDSPAAHYCQTCVDKAGAISGATEVSAWRKTYLEVLLAARRVIVPDSDVATRLLRYAPQIRPPIVRPHARRAVETAPAPRRGPAAPDTRASTRSVAVIGSTGENKGSRVLLAMAADALRRNLPLQFDIIGETSVWADGEWPNVHITGRYEEDEVDALLQSRRCALAFFPAVWPETFCYTLDIAVRNELPCLAFDLGALGRRIRALGVGELMPLAWAMDPGKLNDVLLAFRPDDFDLDRALNEPDRRWRSAADYYESAAPVFRGPADLKLERNETHGP